ncbi:BnaC05g51950D [Brassica napus]|uniref:BnaC05g51950D protein n=1 Tax=Brassica napus TaxID=3708 RepID=A0A078JM20_BRANA|nr:BnaC05g51950D [Brassica napus]
MVILSQIEPSLLVFVEGLRKAGYKVRLAVPDEDTSLSSSPKLLDNTVRFESLYKSLLQDDMMTPMTREVVVPPLFYPPIQTNPPPLYYPPIQTTLSPSPPNPQIYNSPGVFLDLPESLLLGITIIPRQAELGARAHKMSLDIVLWALDNTATYFQPRDLFVFSGNVKAGTDFYNALEALRDRYYNVRVVPHLETCWPHPHHQMSLDHWPKEVVVGFSHGVASLSKQNLKVCGVFVFWDVQGCPTDLSVILQALRKKGYRGKVLLIPYLDMDYQGDELFTYDGYACVPSIKVQGDKYTKVARMLLDILFWAMNHDNHARNLMLISQPSKDIDIFVQALERRFFNVIFKPSHEVAIDHRFESLCKSPPHPNSQTPLKSPCRTLTDLSRERKSCPVRISWLVDTCPSKPSDFCNLFSSTLELKGYGGFESVTAYVEKGKTSDEVIKVCTKSGLQVRLTPDGDEFGKFNLMVTDMINWTYACGPYNFLVISSKPFRDVLCDSVFEDLKSRGCNVLFETVDYMLTFGSTLWSAKSLSDASFSDSSQALA